MKKLLIGLLALGSVTVYANEFYTISRDIHCNLSGTVESVIKERETFPKSIKFKINVTERRYWKSRSNNYAVAKKIITLKDDVPLFVKDAIFMKYSELKIQFKDISKSEFDALLTKLGNDNPISPRTGVKNIQFSIKDEYLTNSWYAGRADYYATVVKQVHYPLKENDGLSYHLRLVCGQFDDHNNKM